MAKLTARTVEAAKGNLMLADGNGLYLRVRETGAKSWFLRYQIAGRRRDCGLGPFPEISLAEARDAAIDMRRMIATGADPIEARREEERKQAAVTLSEAVDEFIAANGHTWVAEYRTRWRRIFDLHAAPLLGKRVDEITTTDVLKVLTPLWQTKYKTGNRLRGFMEQVLDAATVKGQRTGENPARWRGHLSHVLPNAARGSIVHHRALPYAEVPEFLDAVRAVGSTWARALEFVALSACRGGEVVGATWGEVDREKNLLVISAKRMKMRIEHRVPLTPRMLEILDEMEALRPGGIKPTDRIFPSRLTTVRTNSLWELVRTVGYGTRLTTHGLRSVFRTWAAEATDTPGEIAEMCLAHQVGNAVERAYRRGDMLERRRQLMLAWHNHCMAVADNNVIQFATGGR
jgi:integrase